MRRARFLADKLARELLSRAEVPAAARVDIRAVADRLGAQVISIKMAQDGRLVMDGDKALIYTNADQPRARQRFTVAHELGHFACRSPRLSSPVVEGTREAFRSSETMCDTIAGSLLMPYWWVKREFRAAPNDDERPLSVVQDLARAADVSLAAALVRLRDVLGWRQTLLHWTKDDEGWTFDAEAGLFPWEQGMVIPAKSVGMHLSHARAKGTGAIQETCLPLVLGGYEGQVYAEVIARSNSVIALIELPATGDYRTRQTQ